MVPIFYRIIYLNKFILSRYPEIILHKQGEPYDAKFENVNSGYLGAVKMTVVEELIHAAQENLQQVNKNAAIEVNKINEELAGIILSLDTETINKLSEYCQLQAVPDDFPFAKKANVSRHITKRFQKRYVAKYLRLELCRSLQNVQIYQHLAK